MSIEDQIGYLTSKIASLEAKLAAFESQGDNPTTEGRLHTTPLTTIDPKGRKIWEAEWRGDYKVMMAYVPDNALVVDGENVEVEADDKDGDEVTLADGAWYLHVYKNKTTGLWEAELNQEPTGTREDEEAKYNIHICDIHEDGYVEKQYVVGSIIIGKKGVEAFVGDTGDSEPTDGRSQEDGTEGLVVIQGAGVEDEESGSQMPVSGLQVHTEPAKNDDTERGKVPHVIIDIIDRKKVCKDEKAWGAKTLTIKGKDGDKKVHFLGCDDAAVAGEDGGSGGSAADVIGSDYIDVGDVSEEDDDGNVTTKREVSAKIITPDPDDRTIENPAHALLTHDTNQLVRSKKTFLGLGQNDNALKKVILDGPNGRVEVQNENGNRIIKLDAADIPNECGQGGATTIQVRKLTVTHPRAKNGKTADIYHVIGCADIDVQEGDAIQSITSGTPTQSGGFTVTPVTITLKDGTSLPAFNVSAKNGADGDDAGLKVAATTHQPTQSDPRTGIDVTLTPTVNGVDQTPTSFTVYDGKDGVGVGSVEEDTSKASGRTRTYNVMSDEDTPKLLGSFTVTDGQGIGSVVLKSTSGKTRTYSVMSADTPAVELGTFTVTDGADGENGDAAGFGTPTATATELEAGSTPTASVTASGPDTAKVFAFQFGIPKGKDGADGVSASGSNYIDVSSAGVVSAKVSPTSTDAHALVTTDTAQTINGIKVFDSSAVRVKNSQGGDEGGEIDIFPGDGYGGYCVIDAYKESLRIYKSISSGRWVNITLNRGASAKEDTILLTSGRLVRSGKPDDSESKESLELTPLGLLNDKFLRIANLVAGSNIKITPDATNPKKLTISATGGATLNHSFSWEGSKKADIAASVDIAVDSKTIQGSGGITVTEQNRVITISGSGSQVSGYTTVGEADYELTGLEWDSTNHRMVIHKVKKIYKNGLLDKREAIADEYIQFVEETVSAT